MPRDASIARDISDWFAGHARDLPWRAATAPGRRDPYRTLVSELMLQQTQVSRVIDKFNTFIGLFPTANDLARADEDTVLAAWAGLGYYRRARLLHAAARAIRDDFGGITPETEDELRALPGVGRYTAAAVACFAAGARVPVVDGNIARVLLRLEDEPMRHADPATDRWAWARAAALTAAIPDEVDARSVAEGLMELGATTCAPKSPDCERCPLSSQCRALASGTQREIPLPKAAIKRRVIDIACALVRDPDGRLLVEQRPAQGLWARLWQPICTEHTRSTTADQPCEMSSAQAAATQVQARFPELHGISGLAPIGSFTHQTTHREVRFRVLGGSAAGPAPEGTRWVTDEELAGLAVGNAHLRAIALATDPAGNPSGAESGSLFSS